MPALVGVEEMVVMVVLCVIVCMVYGINAWPVFLLPILSLLTDNPSKNSPDFPSITIRLFLGIYWVISLTLIIK